MKPKRDAHIWGLFSRHKVGSKLLQEHQCRVYAVSLNMCHLRNIHSQRLWKHTLSPPWKQTAKHNTHNSCPNILFSFCWRCWLLSFNDSWSLWLLYSIEESSCTIGTCCKRAFLSAQSSRCSEMVRNFIEWAAAWPFGPNTLSILFQPSAAVGSTVYSLLCFKMEKKTVDRSTNDAAQLLQRSCVKYIQPQREQTWINKTSRS